MTEFLVGAGVLLVAFVIVIAFLRWTAPKSPNPADVEDDAG